MIPLVDTHCHLCAGLDDGPATLDETVEMCRMAWEEGTRWIAATAHQNERWSEVTPERILASTRELTAELRRIELPLTVCPTAEVMVAPDTHNRWTTGELLSYGNRRAYLLIEYPHGTFVDVRELVAQLRADGIRPVLAHAERQPELLHDEQRIDELIGMGCLVQVSSASVTASQSEEDTRALKRWVRRGVVHLIGSDGHSTGRRAPRLAEAYRRIVSWGGTRTGDRICSTNGLAVLQGLPLRVDPPQAPKRGFFARFG